MHNVNLYVEPGELGSTRRTVPTDKIRGIARTTGVVGDTGLDNKSIPTASMHQDSRIAPHKVPMASPDQHQRNWNYACVTEELAG